jgi:hypothetical protein
MFRHMNAAMPLFPQQQLCIDITHPWTPPCYFVYNSGICAWYPSHHVCFPITIHYTPTINYVVGPGPVHGPPPPGDPVEQLQTLRRQLEVAMAGLEAQERVMRAQQDASRARGAASEKK